MAASAGVARTLATQRNMKIHWLAAIMVTLVATALPFDLSMRVALIFSVAMVLFAEILNTALEAFVDLHIKEYHRLAMLAKDAAAAGVGGEQRGGRVPGEARGRGRGAGRGEEQQGQRGHPGGRWYRVCCSEDLPY